MKTYRHGSVLVTEDESLGNLEIVVPGAPAIFVRLKIENADRWDLLAAVMQAQGQQPFDKRCADAMADAIDFMVRTKLIDSRSPAADALLSYREGKPTSERSDQLVDLQQKVAELEKRNEELRTSFAKFSREIPYPDEIKNWTEQRGKLVAEIGTLRAELDEHKTLARVLDGDLKNERAERVRLLDVCVDRNRTINGLNRMLGDAGDQILALHKERISALEAKDAEIAQERASKDGAYRERNQLAVAFAHMALEHYYQDFDKNALTSMTYTGWYAGVGRHQPNPDPTWDPEWLTVLFIDTPAGQLSWHLHDSDKPLLEGLPKYMRPWDGHTTAEKYDRIEKLFKFTKVAS